MYRWSGITTEAPVQLSSFNVAGLNLEGAMQVNEGGILSLNKLQFVSDDGDNVYYADGIAAKDLVQNNFKKFSSDIVTSAIIDVLPITFESFAANRQGDAVALQWKVGQMTNVQSFDILRSGNGRNFTPVGNVAAISSQNIYSFTDKNISGEKLYYRIKAIEFNANEFLSDIRSVNKQLSNETVSVYPNPVINNQFTITANVSGIKTVNVYTENSIK